MIHSGLNLGLKYKSSQTTVNKAQVDNESLHLSSENYLNTQNTLEEFEFFILRITWSSGDMFVRQSSCYHQDTSIKNDSDFYF